MRSPLLANLFLSYALDAWLWRIWPHALFMRYVDGMIVHCRSLAEAQALRRWAMRKDTRLRGRRLRAWRWLGGVSRRQRRLFAHCGIRSCGGKAQ